ncbi:hypothetical protein ACFXGA_09995 [Actinosynnema sp. NPDC059335]|uniref:Rv1733c family protein n=1 Tax=Actinosynnema sp. NPDC059335 TaxID=3346804 RepID=UPI00366F7E27
MEMWSGGVVSRLARRFWVWRNPLARAGDRLESGVALVAVTVALTGLPVAAALGSEVHVRQVALSSEQSRTRHQVDAVLSVDTPGDVGGTEHTATTTYVVHATWALPDGTARQGAVRVTGGRSAGSEIPIWVDDGGSPVDPPLTAEGAVVTAATVAVGSWLALGGAMALLYGLVRGVHVKLRRQRWALEWAAVEPGWRKLA